MKRTQERVIAERERKLVQMEKDKVTEAKEKIKAKERKREKERKKLKTLSFNYEEDEGEEEELDGDGDSGKRELKAVVEEMKEKKKVADATSPEVGVKKKRFGMNPDVETKFLPDRDRDDEENFLREKLRLEWDRMQKTVKEEEVDIVYSYWDGSGHKHTVSMRKGNTIYQFLCKVPVTIHPSSIARHLSPVTHHPSIFTLHPSPQVLDLIRNEFPELKTASGDGLMCVRQGSNDDDPEALHQ